jgi:hypothetical protein
LGNGLASLDRLDAAPNDNGPPRMGRCLAATRWSSLDLQKTQLGMLMFRLTSLAVPN